MNAKNTTATVEEIMGEIRIDADLTESMIRIAAAETNGGAVTTRLESDCNFMTRALRMGHEIMVATTLAQGTGATAAVFPELLSKLSFSGKDQELAAVGRTLLARIRKLARLPDAEIPDHVVATRFDQILAAI